MHLCRVGGIPLQLHWTFLVLLGYLAWEGGRAAGLLGAVWLLGFVIAAFACVVLHELGHACMAGRFGVRTDRILLMPIGGMAAFDRIPRRPREELLIAVAGPAMNVALVLLGLVLGVRFAADWDPLLFPLTLAEFGRHLVAVNVVMGLFNFLPIFPMDGGRVLRALLSMRLPYLQATRWAVGTGKVLALAAMGLLAFWPNQPNWMGMALFTFIFFAGEMELRSVKRQAEDEQRWRETLARFYRDAGVDPPVYDAQPDGSIEMR